MKPLRLPTLPAIETCLLLTIHATLAFYPESSLVGSVASAAWQYKPVLGAGDG